MRRFSSEDVQNVASVHILRPFTSESIQEEVYHVYGSTAVLSKEEDVYPVVLFGREESTDRAKEFFERVSDMTLTLECNILTNILELAYRRRSER